MMLTRDKEGFIDSPVFCEHANEVPHRCPCDGDCYCKAHTCKHIPLGGRAAHAPLGIPSMSRLRLPLQRVLYSQMKPRGDCKSDGEGGCALHRIYYIDCAFDHSAGPLWVHLECPECYSGFFSIPVGSGSPETGHHMASCGHCGQRFKCVDAVKVT